MLGILLMALILSNSCQESVNFPAEFRPQLVVYCILSTETDTQYVRVLSNFAENLTSSRDSAITGSIRASVDVSDGTNVFSFRDSIITTPNGDTLQIFLRGGFRPQAGGTYFLRVSVPGYDRVTSVTHVPDHAVLKIDYPDNAVIKNPWYGNGVPDPLVSFSPSAGASAYLATLTMIYHDNLPGGTVQKRVPIPRAVQILDCFFGKFKFRYPEIVPVGSGNGGVSYRWENFSWRLNVDLARDSYDPHFERGIFTVIQFSEEWYKYYNSARIYQDRFSLRLDMPDFANIVGGRGIFGSYVVDTASIKMLDQYSPPRRCQLQYL